MQDAFGVRGLRLDPTFTPLTPKELQELRDMMTRAYFKDALVNAEVYSTSAKVRGDLINIIWDIGQDQAGNPYLWSSWWLYDQVMA